MCLWSGVVYSDVNAVIIDSVHPWNLGPCFGMDLPENLTELVFRGTKFTVNVNLHEAFIIKENDVDILILPGGSWNVTETDSEIICKQTKPGPEPDRFTTYGHLMELNNTLTLFDNLTPIRDRIGHISFISKIADAISSKQLEISDALCPK